MSGGWLQRDELRDCGFELVELERFAQENGIRPKRPHLVLNPVGLERRCSRGPVPLTADDVGDAADFFGADAEPLERLARHLQRRLELRRRDLVDPQRV